MATVIRLISLTRYTAYSNTTFAVNCGKTQVQNLLVPARNVASRSRADTLRKAVRRSKIRSEEGPVTSSRKYGLLALAGSSAAAMGALCYYGLGLSNQIGAIDKMTIWPQFVRDRIKSTYGHLIVGLGVTAASAASLYRTKFAYRFMTANPLLAIGGSLVAMIGTSYICHSIPYQEGLLNSKHLAWLVHAGTLGFVISPLMFMGGPLLMRAAAITGGVVGGLSMIAVCAPSEKFLNWGGPLGLALGGVCMASIGSAFIPATGMLGVGLYSISLYGGLIVFSGLLLYDTQKLVRKAETHSVYHPVKYDPINESISIYMDIVNIFIRIATILAAGGGSRRR